MPTVFVLQEPSPRALTGWVPDIRPAGKHGNIKYIFTSKERPHRMDQLLLEDRLREAFQDYNADEDSILWCGGDIITLLLTIALLSAHYGYLYLLQWQRLDSGGFYSRTPIDFKPLLLEK